MKSFIKETMLIVLVIFIVWAYTLPGSAIEKINTFTLEMEIIRGVPVVDVNVNGKYVRLVVDTGADTTEISLKKEVINKLQLTKIDANRSYDIRGNAYFQNVYKVENTQIGDLNLNNLRVKEEQRNLPNSIDGIIGNKVLEAYTMFLDYKNKVITLWGNDDYQKIVSGAEWVKINYEKSVAGILLGVQIGGDENMYDFIFDTGSAIIDGENSFTLIKKSIIPGDKGHILNADKIYINGHRFGPLSFYGVKLGKVIPFEGLIGYDFIKEHQIILNYKNQCLYINTEN